MIWSWAGKNMRVVFAQNTVSCRTLISPTIQAIEKELN